MENKEDIFIKKLKEESNNDFINCISMFDINEYVKVKKIFYSFLYEDIIKINLNNKNNIDININSILNNPTDTINQNLQDTYSKILNYNNELVLEFKKEMMKKISVVRNKISECKVHIDLIKKEYINASLEKYLPINNKKTIFMFESKNILTLFSKQDELILSEFFTKFIFYLIEKKKDNNTDIKTYFDNFYDIDKINSYIDPITYQIRKFQDIDNSFKYWLIIMFLSNQIFAKKSKYVIFNNIELDTHIKSLLTPKKEPNKKKEKKKNKKDSQKKKGGGSKDKEFSKIIEARKNNLKKNKKEKKEKKDDKKPELAKFYESIYEFKILNVKIGDTYEKKSFKDVYYDLFNNNIRLYFYSELLKLTSNNPLENKQVDKIFINHPFNPTKKISAKIFIKDNFKKLTKKIIEDEKLNIFNIDLKFNIYESLYLFLEPDNYNEIYKFIENVKSKLLLLLFYLYNIKLTIYNSYIEKINQIFNVDINKKPNELKENIEVIENNSKNIIKSQINISEISNNQTNKFKNIDEQNSVIIKESINNKIKKKQNELLLIKDDIGIRNYDNKILEIEKELKNLIISKYIGRIQKK